ncbi:MAG: hypothetical protein EOO40_05290 [Deltaproteobacteria bacterium]|nr:MAG: hypothetical protein EOO40_05290 [Deltaproteobacteria bacterium]
MKKMLRVMGVRWLSSGALLLTCSCMGGNGCNQSPDKPSIFSRTPGSVETSPDVHHKGTVGNSDTTLMPRTKTKPSEPPPAVQADGLPTPQR